MSTPVFCCIHCGRPVAAEGVTIPLHYDFDHEGKMRQRCSDTACVSAARATYVGEDLIGLVEDKNNG